MSDKQPSIKKNYLMNLAYQIIAIVLPIITTPYVSRVLHADGIGAYSYTFSIATYFSLFATLGVATYGQLEIAKCRNETENRTILLYEIFVGRAVLTFIIVIAYFASAFIFGTYRNLYILMAINIIAVALDISWFFQGLELFKLTVVRNLIIRIASAILIFVFVRKESDLFIYTIIIQGSTLVGNVALFPYLKRYCAVILIRKPKIFRHWKKSLSYFIPTIATSVYTVLDKSMIGWLTNSSLQNGYYEQSHKIEQMLLLGVTALGTVTLPRMVYLFNNGNQKEIKRLTSSTLTFILCLSLPLSMGTFFIAPVLVPVFLGEGYESCVILLRVFSFLIIIVGLDNTIGKQCLMATGKQKQFNIGVIVGALCNLLINLLLIPHFQALGAAIGSVCAELVILTIFMVFCKKMLDYKMLIKTTIKYFVVSLFMGIMVWQIGISMGVSLLTLIIQLAAGIIIYFGVLLIFRDSFVFGFFKSIIKKFRRN